MKRYGLRTAPGQRGSRQFRAPAGAERWSRNVTASGSLAPSRRENRTSGAIIGCMQAHVVVVHPGMPTMADIVVAGVPLQAEWVGLPPNVGELVDVELDIDVVLGWADAIAMDGAEATLREGPKLRGNVELQERDLLTVRIATGASAGRGRRRFHRRPARNGRRQGGRAPQAVSHRRVTTAVPDHPDRGR